MWSLILDLARFLVAYFRSHRICFTLLLDLAEGLVADFESDKVLGDDDEDEHEEMEEGADVVAATQMRLGRRWRFYSCFFYLINYLCLRFYLAQS